MKTNKIFEKFGIRTKDDVKILFSLLALFGLWGAQFVISYEGAQREYKIVWFGLSAAAVGNEQIIRTNDSDSSSRMVIERYRDAVLIEIVTNSSVDYVRCEMFTQFGYVGITPKKVDEGKFFYEISHPDDVLFITCKIGDRYLSAMSYYEGDINSLARFHPRSTCCSGFPIMPIVPYI